ncbi:Restriction endonuclease subunit S [Tenacibaculum sp. 190524A02b]|uniref:restriction endonuclease subunit S n=1 Tax=Tenacibaculum vairaonense TaxID=3137860 RepID=UPI0032B25791
MELVSIKSIIEKPITGEWGTEGNGVNVIRTTNFTNEGKLNLENVVKRIVDEKKVKAKKLVFGDVIIEKSGGSPKQPVGRVVFFDQKTELYLCNNFTSILRPKKDKVYPKYLLFILFINHQKGVTSRYQNKTTGIINLKLQNYISELKIPLPSLPEQKRIAAILDEADKLRQLNTQLIKKYDALMQSLFLDMFGDVGMSKTKENFIQLKELITQKPDNGFFAKKDLYNSLGTPVVWLNNFIDKIYIDQMNLRRAQVSRKDDKYALEYGDALFCRSSLTVEGIGKCAIVPESLKEKTLFECHIIRLKFNLDKIVPEYFRFLSNTNYFRSNIKKRAKTSTMTTISQDGITDIKIPVPPIQLQIQFRESLRIIQEQKQQAQAALQKSEDLFNSLLQKAFKGQL